MVCVEIEKTTDSVTFYAVSRADHVSITFSVSAPNMTPSSPPIITRALSRGRTELLTLKTIAGKKPVYEHAFMWEWGAAGATHDDRVRYRLPFQSGQKVFLFQGPDGATTHKGKFAFDFPVPIGTPVCAARGGIVIEVIDQFDEGGDDQKFGEMANKILVLHDDDTIGAYAHFLRGGMRVKTEDRVEVGTVIGTSGNSGWSSGPHVHFEVYRKLENGKQETLPVKFHAVEGRDLSLEEKKWYRVE